MSKKCIEPNKWTENETEPNQTKPNRKTTIERRIVKIKYVSYAGWKTISAETMCKRHAWEKKNDENTFSSELHSGFLLGFCTPKQWKIHTYAIRMSLSDKLSILSTSPRSQRNSSKYIIPLIRNNRKIQPIYNMRRKKTFAAQICESWSVVVMFKNKIRVDP